jgi:2'-5' RNA ligase
LLAFQAELARTLENQGFRSDTRPWEPHVTLYRDLRNRCATMDIEPVVWRPREFCLMQSGRCPKGVVYTVVERWAA